MDIHTTIDITAPAELAWDVLGERFGAISDWASAITSSSLSGELARGAMRTCDIGGIGGMGPMQLHEELIEFDRSERKLAYRVQSGLPRVIRQAINRWQVRAMGPGRCEVTSHATLEVAWFALPMAPLMQSRMAADIRKLGDELRVHIEAEQGARSAA